MINQHKSLELGLFYFQTIAYAWHIPAPNKNISPKKGFAPAPQGNSWSVALSQRSMGTSCGFIQARLMEMLLQQEGPEDADDILLNRILHDIA